MLLEKCKEVMVVTRKFMFFKADEHEFDGKEITSYHLTSAHPLTTYLPGLHQGDQKYQFH